MRKIKLRCAPRVRMHANETMTVSGIDARDLRDIVTAARLHRYANPVTTEKNDPESFIWERRIVYILETLDRAILDRYHETYPWHAAPKTKQERLAAVREEIRIRKLIDEITEKELSRQRAAQTSTTNA
jgi:hypothetical protein